MVERLPTVTMYAGDRWELQFVLGGGCGQGQLKWGLALRGALLVTRTSAGGITVADDVATMVMATADTRQLTPGEYRHELVHVDQAGEQLTLAWGVIVVAKGLF